MRKNSPIWEQHFLTLPGAQKRTSDLSVKVTVLGTRIGARGLQNLWQSSLIERQVRLGSQSEQEDRVLEYQVG